MKVWDKGKTKSINKRNLTAAKINDKGMRKIPTSGT